MFGRTQRRFLAVFRQRSPLRAPPIVFCSCRMWNVGGPSAGKFHFPLAAGEGARKFFSDSGPKRHVLWEFLFFFFSIPPMALAGPRSGVAGRPQVFFSLHAGTGFHRCAMVNCNAFLSAALDEDDRVVI